MGRVNVPMQGTRKALPIDADVHLITSDGQLHKTYCDEEGLFMLSGLPVGHHVLTAHLVGYVYPEIHVEIGRKGRMLRAYFSIPTHKTPLTLQEPLAVHPISEISYYAKRPSFDITTFLFTPYGIMIAFSLFLVFVLPNLKMDPEEYQRAKQEMGSMGLGGLVGGSAPAVTEGDESSS